MEIESIFPLSAQVNNEMTYAPFLERIQVVIENQIVHAASDASLKEGQLGGHWLLTNNRKSKIAENTLSYK